MVAKVQYNVHKKQKIKKNLNKDLYKHLDCLFLCIFPNKDRCKS